MIVFFQTENSAGMLTFHVTGFENKSAQAVLILYCTADGSRLPDDFDPPVLCSSCIGAVIGHRFFLSPANVG